MLTRKRWGNKERGRERGTQEESDQMKKRKNERSEKEGK